MHNSSFKITQFLVRNNKFIFFTHGERRRGLSHAVASHTVGLVAPKIIISQGRICHILLKNGLL